MWFKDWISDINFHQKSLKTSFSAVLTNFYINKNSK